MIQHVVTTAEIRLSYGQVIPPGVHGLLCETRLHLDLGPLIEHGWGGHQLPILDNPPTSYFETLGEWDGTNTGFTKVGWVTYPILAFRMK